MACGTSGSVGRGAGALGTQKRQGHAGHQGVWGGGGGRSAPRNGRARTRGASSEWGRSEGPWPQACDRRHALACACPVSVPGAACLQVVLCEVRVEQLGELGAAHLLGTHKRRQVSGQLDLPRRRQTHKRPPDQQTARPTVSCGAHFCRVPPPPKKSATVKLAAGLQGAGCSGGLSSNGTPLTGAVNPPPPPPVVF
jgi:hypothetical protein